MNIGKLRQLLSDVGQVLSAAGSDKQAQDLERVASLMRGRDQQSLGQFLSELEVDLKPLSGEALAAAYVSRLKEAAVDETQVTELLAMMSKDKSVTKPLATNIAHAYIGGSSKFSSKNAAVEAIRKEFVSRRYDESKMKEVARSRPW